MPCLARTKIQNGVVPMKTPNLSLCHLMMTRTGSSISLAHSFLPNDNNPSGVFVDTCIVQTPIMVILHMTEIVFIYEGHGLVLNYLYSTSNSMH